MRCRLFVFLRGAGRLVQEPPVQLRRGDHARVPLPEPAVAVARDPAVHRIADRLRHRYEAVQQRPRVPQPAQHTQSGGRLRVDAASFDEHEGIEGGRRQAVPGKQPLPGFRLQRREPDLSGRVAAHGEPDGGIAQVADAVEQDHRPGDGFRAAKWSLHRDHPPVLVSSEYTSSISQGSGGRRR